MTNVQQDLDFELQYLIQIAPLIKKLFVNDVAINISNTEKFLLELPSKDFPQAADYNPLRALTPADPIVAVMKSNRPSAMTVSKELFGYDAFFATIPIPNSKGQVIGSLTISSSLKNQAELAAIAEKFAVSSEEIGASTLELSSTAKNLTHNMETIEQAQNNLTTQVNDSTKILELINSVAKSTRILGFNAGIEAARSGEHGQGFAVVTKEITKLADQSSDAVNEIHKLLNAMKDKVEEVTFSVQNTIAVASVQTTTLNEIADSIQNLTIVAEQIDELAQKI